MIKKRAALSLILVIAIMLSCLLNTYASNDNKLYLDLVIGSTTAKINGVISKLERPYVVNKTVMLPLGWLATAIGAEVNTKSAKVTEIIYGDTTAVITLGSVNYKVNGETNNLSVAPTLKNNKLMVPIDFISKNFPFTVKTDLKKGTVKLTLEDDGALSDLSFLTGGISNPKVGNSFYGWSLSVPSGSRIILSTFKSDKIGITTESRNLYFEIAVESKNGKTLSELFNDMTSTNTVRTSSIDLKAAVPYFQYTRLTEYDESLRVKVFDKGDYFYYLTINCYDNSVTPEKLITDKYYDNIIKSFSFDYKGNTKGVQDTSKIKQGQADYYNYIDFKTGVKYLPWSIKVPAKWNKLEAYSDPRDTLLGVDMQHSVKISTKVNIDGLALEEYADQIKSYYDNYFSSKVYTFISSDFTQISENDAINLKFSLKEGGKTYIIDEYYVLKNDIAYEISVTLPEAEYSRLKPEYTNALNKMALYSLDTSYAKDNEKYNNKNTWVRISQQDDLIDYTNKSYKWNAKVPGFWEKDSSDSEDNMTFINRDTLASFTVASYDSSASVNAVPEELKNSIMKAFTNNDTSKLIDKSNETKSGYEVSTYTYKVDSDEVKFHATVTFRFIKTNKYVYSIRTVVHDLTATDIAVKEVDDIWKSFNITDK